MKLTPYQQSVYAGKICPYCGAGTKVVSEEFIYGRSYKGKSMICCVNYPSCHSYCGTHKDDGSSLGRLANQNLRKLKKMAHDHFDWLWMNDHLERTEAYEDLSEYLNIEPDYTHIGFFNEDTCKKAIQWAIERRKEIERTNT